MICARFLLTTYTNLGVGGRSQQKQGETIGQDQADVLQAAPWWSVSLTLLRVQEGRKEGNGVAESVCAGTAGTPDSSSKKTTYNGLSSRRLLVTDVPESTEVASDPPGAGPWLNPAGSPRTVRTYGTLVGSQAGVEEALP